VKIVGHALNGSTKSMVLTERT